MLNVTETLEKIAKYFKMFAKVTKFRKMWFHLLQNKLLNRIFPTGNRVRFSLGGRRQRDGGQLPADRPPTEQELLADLRSSRQVNTFSYDS